MGKAARLRQAGRKGPAFQRSTAPDSAAFVAAVTGLTGKLPAGVEACAGFEVEHADGVTECTEGVACVGSEALHDRGMSCGLLTPFPQTIEHVCDACRHQP